MANAAQTTLRANRGYDVLRIPAAEALGSAPHFIGSASASYSIVEFGDYQCPYCRAAEPRVKAILATLNGKVNLVFRHLPLVTLHDRAMEAAIGVEAAAEQGKYLPFHEALMSRDLTPQAILEAARNVGIEMETARRSGSSTARTRVMRDLSAAGKLNVSATPTFFVVTPAKETLRFDNIGKVEQYFSSVFGLKLDRDGAEPPVQACGGENVGC